MKKNWWRVIVGSVLVLLVAALAIGNLVQAAPDFRPLQALLGTSFSYQGHLEDGGAPANGTYDLRFSLWDASSVGSQVGSDVVKEGESVEDGLFTVDLDFGDLFDGTAMWLEVEVKGPGDPDYTALSPRQALTAVPYAHYALNIPDHDHWGESWTGTGDGLTLTSSDGNGLVGVSSTVGSYGIVGTTDAYVSFEINPTTAGVYGQSTASSSWSPGVGGSGAKYGVWGAATEAGGVGVYGQVDMFSGQATGVLGFTQSSEGIGVEGFAGSGSGTTYGVYGSSSSPDGRGVYGEADSDSGLNFGVYGISESPDGYGAFFANVGGGDLLSLNDASNTTELEFIVDNDGDVYADGTYSSPAADFAEMLPAVEGLEAGDVLTIDLEGILARSTQAYQPTVIGVYSTQPGFLGGASDGDDLTGKIPLAILGVVPVKASAENGSIQPGDMLVASDTPGHAMRAGEDSPQGTVIGKALEALDDGTGIILMIVTLQ